MQTWAKRGIQTALVTGGLLMLGTGIASADEDVNPDRPAPPLDGSLVVPLNIDNNALGSPFGQQVDLPKVKTELVNVHVMEVTGDAGQLASAVTAPCFDGNPLLGNRASLDLVAPIDISGNAIGLLGDAAVANESSQTIDQSRPIFANGTSGVLAANVLDLDYAAPVQLTGNAIAGLGTAHTENSSSQHVVTDGDVGTDGTAGFLAGNLLAGHGSTPVQATGNAISAGGLAFADSKASTESAAGGALYTEGTHGVGAGNVAALPLAIPAELNNNSIGAAANTLSTGSADMSAQAGRRHGQQTLDAADGTYIVTNGQGGALSGNIAQPGAATPVTVLCNAVAALAVAEADCTHYTEAISGGGNRTTGNYGVGSGTIIGSPAAVPGDIFSNAAAVGGEAITTDSNTVIASAGGDNFTRADNGAAAGTVIAPSASGPAEVFSNAGAAVGDALTSTDNTSTASSGGFNGTSGNDSVGGGNTVPLPVTVPGEAFGNAVAGVGNASAGDTTEVKESAAGGDASTDDDGGVGAANVLGGGVAGPVQLIGNGAGAVGNATSGADSSNEATAGGDTKATGTGGVLAGNIGQALVSLPAQGFANNVSAAGTGEAVGDVYTASTAGGNAESDGMAGVLAGNVASVPAGSAAQAFGDSAAALGLSQAAAQNTTDSAAGGTILTSGEHGVLSGNAASGQAMPIVQGFGAAVAGVGGLNTSEADNGTTAASGGDIDTNGDHGTISGNLVDVPAAVATQDFGDSVSAVGAHAMSSGENVTTGTAGGTSTTSGINGMLSGLDATLPVSVIPSVYGVPVEVLAEAMAEAANAQSFSVGETEPMLHPALDGATSGGLPVTEAPRLPVESAFSPVARQSRTDTPSVPSLGPVSGLLGGGALGGATPAGLTGGLPNLAMPSAFTGGLGQGGLPGVPQAGLPSVPHLPQTPALSTLPALPGSAPAISAPKVGSPVPALGLGGVTGVLGGLLGGGVPSVGSLAPSVPSVPSVPGSVTGRPSVPGVPASVPGLSTLPGLTKAPAVSAPSLGTLPVSPSLNGLNTSQVTDSASLTDTQSKLSKLLGEHMIG
jgi:hypothetical protein